MPGLAIDSVAIRVGHIVPGLGIDTKHRRTHIRVARSATHPWYLSCSHCQAGGFPSRRHGGCRRRETSTASGSCTDSVSLLNGGRAHALRPVCTDMHRHSDTRASGFSRRRPGDRLARRGPRQHWHMIPGPAWHWQSDSDAARWPGPGRSLASMVNLPVNLTGISRFFGRCFALRGSVPGR